MVVDVVEAAVVEVAVEDVVVNFKPKYFNDIVWKKINDLQFDDESSTFPFSKRLARENRWPHWFALDVIEEYRKFLYLLVRADHKVTPSVQVDQAWHLHLIYSRSYWEDFAAGLPLDPHHGPTKGGKQEDEKFIYWYSKTLSSYEEIFELKPPIHIWPNKDERFRPNQQWQWVDASRYYIIKQNTGYVYMIIILFFIVLSGLVF